MFSLATWHYIWRSLSLFAEFRKYVGFFFKDCSGFSLSASEFHLRMMSGSVFPCENVTAGCRLGWRAGDQSSSTRSKLLLLVNTFLRVLKTSAIENQLILENRNNYTWIETILFSSHLPCYNQHCLRVVFALHFSLIYSHHTTQPVF